MIMSLKRKLLVTPLIVTLTALAIFTVRLSATPEDTNQVSAGDRRSLITILQDNAASTHLLCEISDYKIESVETGDQTFDRISIDGVSTISRQGLPDLPAVSSLILVPPQSGVHLKINRISQHTKRSIRPVIAPYQNDETTADLSEPPDCLPYDGFYPPDPVVVGKPAILRGYRLVPVTVFPFQYNRTTNELRVNEMVDMELVYSGIGENIVRNSNPQRKSIIFDRLLRSIVDNPPSPSRDDPPCRGSLAYVIGEGEIWDNVLEELEPLIEWRRRMGWTVELIRVENPTEAVLVKDAIQEAYDEWNIPPEAIVICGDTRSQFRIGFHDERRGSQYNYETDHHFGELEGDDILVEAAVGRLVYTDPAMLRGIVEKIINYESDPYIGEDEDAGWQLRGAVAATDSRSGLSTIDVSRWARNLMLKNGYESVDELYFQGDGQVNPTEFIQNNITNGISILTYRGWMQMNGYGYGNVGQLRNGRMLPFVILATCNTGDYYDHHFGEFSWTEGFVLNALGGGIGAVGTSGLTQTQYNNLYISAILRALFCEGIHTQGWALARAKLEIFRNYAAWDDVDHPRNREESWLMSTFMYNLMGDPAVDLYTDVPRNLIVDRPETIRRGDTRFDVHVGFEDVEEDAQGVQVCLYKPEEFQLVALTDEEGRVSFSLDPVWTADGEIMLTVTGHNLMPCLVDYDIEAAESFIGVGEYIIDDGDDDVANPLEELEIHALLVNFGENRPEGALTATLTPFSPQLEVIEGEVQIDQAPPPGESVDANFVVGIGGGFPHGEDAVFNLLVTVGEDEWLNSISFPVEGPQIEFESLLWIDEPLRPAEIADLTITIRNTGSYQLPPVEATLFSHTPTVEIINANADYDIIPAGDLGESENVFRITANLLHLKGSPAHLALAVESDNGFTDTTFFSIVVDTAGEGDPFGPDNYGYICFDDTDEDWRLAPVFDWIEIDPERGGDGIDTKLSDRAEEQDESVVIQLPFVFQYYGVEYDEITVCTNGWISMGDQSNLNTARNRRIPSGMVAESMICPFWDDLLTTNEGGIYSWYDEENNIFIVEWSQMLRLGPNGNNEDSETFQVILYDPRFYPTISGDGEIVFQYFDVTDSRSCIASWDTPFATVGIGNPDQTDGLEYTYWNQLHDGAAPLEPERAIKFTTFIVQQVGVLHGHVTDASTGNPIEDVNIFSSLGQMAITDAEGYWRMDNAIAEFAYSITASMQGYNSMTFDNVELPEDSIFVIDFALLHPEFAPSTDRFDLNLPPGGQIEHSLDITNNGNGLLEWSATRHLVGDADREPWELRRSFLVSQMFDDDRIEGVVYIDDHFYVASGNDYEPIVHILNRDGEPVDSFYQFEIVDRRGMRDLAWDGELIWGAFERTIYGFTVDGELVTSFNSPFNPTTSLAFDPQREVIWMAATTTDIIAMTREGEEIDSLEIMNNGLRIYSLAYWWSDPDGYPLYVVQRERDTEGVAIHKIDPVDGDVQRVAHLHPDLSCSPAGSFITNQFDHYSWIFINVTSMSENSGGDRLEIWQLDVRKDWFELNQVQGLIPAGGVQELTLFLDAAELADTLYQGELHFCHNADSGLAVIPVNVDVGIVSAPNETSPGTPVEFGISSTYPNPFNSATRVRFGMNVTGYVSLRVFDIAGREVTVLYEGNAERGYQTVDWNAFDLPSGIYLMRLESAGRMNHVKVALIR